MDVTKHHSSMALATHRGGLNMFGLRHGIQGVSPVVTEAVYLHPDSCVLISLEHGADL